MRRILFAVGLLAFTVSTGAQTTTPTGLGIKRFSALKAERVGNVTHLTGKVAVWAGTALVTADEAFVNLETDEIEFRGTVRMRAAQ
jgi:hypothetical protein